MDTFENLRWATLLAQEDNDLPDFLAARILRIVEQSQRYRHCREEIAELIEQVGHYDTYGQTGYLGMGVNNFVLEGTLRRVEEKADPPETRT